MNHGRLKRLSLLTLSAALSCQSVSGDSMRCGRKVISDGDSSAEVRRHCGKPRHTDRGKTSIRQGGGFKEVSVERWHYQKNSRSLERIVLIHRGRVVAVESGRR